MNLDFLESDEEQEMLASIEWSNYVFPQPEPIEPRFKSVSEEEMVVLEEVNQSTATKKNTKWGIKLFQGIFILNVINKLTNTQTKYWVLRDNLILRDSFV